MRFSARTFILTRMAANDGRNGNGSGKSELMLALDYILNRCTVREIDAVATAVERRKRDLVATTGMNSLDPARAARDMTAAVNKSIESSMEGIRRTFRQYACDMVRKEAPELTEEQMEDLVDSLVGDMPTAGANLRDSLSGTGPGSRDAANPAGGTAKYSGLAHKGLVNGVPADVMYEMVCQFVSYSTGSMSLSDESALRAEVGDWTTVYWNAFPREVRACVKGFLSGELNGNEMDERLTELLR